MVPFFDLGRIHRPLAAELEAAFRRVLEDGRFIMGPDVAALEAEFAEYVGVEHAIGVSSGTDALLAVLMAYDIGPGDEVLVPSLTFFATAGAVARLGATPVFVDVDPDTLLMDVAQALERVTPATRAVSPVHLFGQCVDLGPLRDAGLVVIEDAAQSHGARDAAGVACGAQGACACFSFFPTKPVGGLGDGGAITTSDPELADRVRLVRTHGARPKFHHLRIGGNFRLDALQAALIRVKLPHTDAWADERRAIHRQYLEQLAPVVASGDLRFVAEGRGTHVYHQHVVRVSARDALREALRAVGIGTAVYYPEPLHVQPCFAGLPHTGAGALPHAEAACREVLAIPCFPGLTAPEVSEVAAAIRRYYGA